MRWPNTITPSDGTVTAAKLSSGTASAGSLPVANGSGGVSFLDVDRSAVESLFPFPAYGANLGSTVSDGTGRFVKYIPTRNVNAVSLAFVKSIAATADDAVEVAIYDSTLTTKLATSGVVTGYMNSVGLAAVPLTAPYTLVAGTVYYLVWKPAAPGGTGATYQNLSQSNALWTVLQGANPPQVLNGNFPIGTASPLPNNINAVKGQTAVAIAIAVRES